MSKKLTPLEWLRYYERIVRESNQTFRPNGLEVIETELKKHNQLQIDYDEMDRINDELNLSNHQLSDENVKLRKALEILKKKKVNVWTLLTTKTVAAYNFREVVVKPKRKLTEKEYNLLKEVLK